MHATNVKNAGKSFLLKVLFVLSSGCGQIEEGYFEKQVDCIDGCSSEKDGAHDTTIIVVEGTPGKSGRDGSNGKTVVGPQGAPGQSTTGTVGPQGVPGQSCSIQDTAYGADITCGSEVVSIFDGSDGVDGIAGQSCSIHPVSGGADVWCGGNYVHIANGEDGADAPFAISEVYDPCGDGPGPDEVVLIFATGEWIAWYQGLGLSILTPGQTYVTTDQSSCQFTVPN